MPFLELLLLYATMCHQWGGSVLAGEVLLAIRAAMFRRVYKKSKQKYLDVHNLTHHIHIFVKNMFAMRRSRTRRCCPTCWRRWRKL